MKELIDIKSSNASIDFLRTLTLASMKIIECILHTFPEIAKMGGDDDREDKERVMAGFLDGSVR